MLCALRSADQGQRDSRVAAKGDARQIESEPQPAFPTIRSRTMICHDARDEVHPNQRLLAWTNLGTCSSERLACRTLILSGCRLDLSGANHSPKGASD